MTIRARRPSILVLLAILALAGATSVNAAPAPSPAPVLQSFLCTLQTAPAGAAAELPGVIPEPESKQTGNCSPLCGAVDCRGTVVGTTCTRLNGTLGTCTGPALGKKCADGLPMCTCA